MQTGSHGIGNQEVGDINLQFEEQDTQKKARSLGLSYIDIAHYPINTDMLKKVEPKDSKNAELLVFDKAKHVLKVAIVDTKNEAAQKILMSIKKAGKEYELFLCSKSGFIEAYKLYNANFLQKKTIVLRETADEENSTDLLALKKHEAEIAKIPSSQALNEIKLFAIRYKASDVHLQPTKNGTTVRFRIDGILHDIFTFDAEVSKGLITRLKYESGMKANVTDYPQDGHTSVQINNRNVDFRVSSMPTQYLESVVIRILDASKGILSFKDLGFSKKDREKTEEILSKKTGMILVTGPTGSGKTTSLYSMLSHINTPEKKITTLEDPIEYQLEGITQSEVSENKQYNFETGLKALVRQDPDVILVGEIRSYQTAKLAVEASLTGHVVFSTLHTNSAVGAIDRLRNLGLENYNIAPGINALFAQRLVRKICPHCVEKQPFKENEKIAKALQKLGKTAPKETCKAIGCEKCGNIGYRGQLALTEIFVFDDTIKKMIIEDESTLEIQKYVEENTDFISLFENGLQKVLEEDTTLDELYRVLG